jgi:hypothetical protein
VGNSAAATVPYAVDGLLSEMGQRAQVVGEHTSGLDLFLDAALVEDSAVERAKCWPRSTAAALHG